LSYAKSNQASDIITELPKEKQVKVVECIARMDSASPETIKIVEKILEKKFASVLSMDFAQVGGVDYIADVMNNIDRSNEKYIFDELSKKDIKLADEIRKKMFVFEDITCLDNRAIQVFLREAETQDIVYALKGSNQEVSNMIFSNMSSRMAETVKSELEFTYNVRLKDVEEAQQKIVAIIRRLEEEGRLIISKGGKDEIIA
jgi:flagellar motor switch protein FliG